MSKPALALLLAGCTAGSPEVAGLATVSVVDGATGVAPNAPLEATAPGLRLSDPRDADAVLAVFDLADGRIVPGQASAPTLAGVPLLRFMPAEPWAEGTTYVWQISPLTAHPRGPRVHVPERLVGQARFTVDAPATVLGAAPLGGGLAPEAWCVVTSGVTDAPDQLRVALDGVPWRPGTVEAVDEAELTRDADPALIPAPSQVPLGVWCLSDDDEAAWTTASTLTVIWGDDDAVELPVGKADPVDRLLTQLRAMP